MGNTWLMADPHLGHGLAAKLRGFDDVAQHDTTIIRNIRRRVQYQDTLFLLGDLAFNGWADRVHRLRIAAELHIILGNHDRPAVNNSRGHTYQRQLMDLTGAQSVLPFARISHEGQTFLLSHYPYDGDHGADRYEQWRLRDLGVPIIHGHTHSSEKLSYSKLGTPQICVSAEAWDMQPASIHEVHELLRGAA
jgi:calcineurin-like phosphoesterase family protein